MHENTEFFQLIKVRGEIQRWKSALIICRYLYDCGIKTASDSVSLTAAETEIKSRSEAMDKFQEEYRQLKAFVKDYRDTLNNDLAKIDLIINAINENDRKQGDYIKNGIGLSDTAVIP